MPQARSDYMGLRATQRAPRSCRSCASRKVKCDKAVPCSTCIKRGEADACAREMVIVRGEVRMWKDEQLPSYKELSYENKRLKEEIDCLRAENKQLFEKNAASESPGLSLRRSRSVEHDDEGLEEKLWDSLAAASAASRSSVSNWDDIVLPNAVCSEKLVAYDKVWNSWVHYALEYPRFEQECTSFIAAVERGFSLEEADPSWMAVYFSVLAAALLMMRDDEANMLTLPEVFDRRRTSRMWYDAAIFSLYRADFMRVPHIHTVQAVAILGMCFNNWGDVEVGQHMWSCALRIARRIALNTPYSNAAASCLSTEGQHRLWWTLVICEWLKLPYRPPEVDNTDFDVPLPSVTLTEAGEDEVSHYHVHYHIFMARTAAAVYRFYAKIRSGSGSSEETVRAVKTVDEELAEIIDNLPPLLQPDTVIADEYLRRLQLAHPWIKWQRCDLTLVLLHMRLRIHRALHVQWLSPPGHHNWARSVSINSAMSIIWINRNWDQPASMRKQWALSHHIFASAILLLRECQTDQAAEREKYHEAVRTALGLLEDVQQWNAIARHAATIIRDRLDKTG